MTFRLSIRGTFLTPTIGAVLGAALLTAASPCQGEKPTGTSGQDPVADEKAEKLQEWPALAKADQDRLLACLSQFRKEKVELQEGARDRLIAIGAGGFPLLVQKLTDQPGNINEHLFAVFDKMLKVEHAALMAREIKRPSIEWRRYLVRRLCRFTDESLLPVLRATMADKDPQIAFHAALGALALGERAAVPAVLEYSKTNWDQVGDDVAEVLPGARSQTAGSWVFEAIAQAPPGDKMAGLRLARYLATKEHSMILKGYLQASDHAVKKEAVNALRVIHGQEPLEKLTVFQVIGMAKEWAAKI